MAGAYSQILLQYVIVVKGRQNLLNKVWRDEVFKYISGIISSKSQKPLIVNGVEDHVHILLGLKPSMNISELIRDIKNNTTNFINEKEFLKSKFSWQEGYGVFSYSNSQLKNVYEYIANQEEHHKKKTFKEEYLEFLAEHDIAFEEKYLFDWNQAEDHSY